MNLCYNNIVPRERVRVESEPMIRSWGTQSLKNFSLPRKKPLDKATKTWYNDSVRWGEPRRSLTTVPPHSEETLKKVSKNP